ncbi:MAG: CDP-alcohol phosphatidyltransferase family protein [Deltaproteobacteria bacterium]|nr:CDP-alcohol phosphatidyltransferase family protein [Deltaproteobacteria bacterium]
MNSMVLNLPNTLTILRILLIPVFAGFYLRGEYDFALLFFLVAGLSDFLDGTIARMFEKKTPFGAILDPAADKFLMLVSFLCLAYTGALPWWLALAGIARDIYLTSGFCYLKYSKFSFKIKPSVWGKLNTFLELSLIFSLFLEGFLKSQGDSMKLWTAYLEIAIQFFIYALLISLVVSTSHYTYQGFQICRKNKK